MIKNILLAYALIVSVSIQGNTWEELFKKNRALIGNKTYRILKNQYAAYAAGNAPAIADACIKSILIIECGDDIIDLKNENNARITSMEGDELIKAHTYESDIDPRSNNYSKMRRGTYQALMRMIESLDLLAPAFDYESGELEIRLFEGLRDLATQKILFDTKKAHFLAQNPGMTEKEAYDKTCTYVSPYSDNVPVHSTGAAVDIALWSNTKGSFCNMGLFNTSTPGAHLFSTDSSITDEQRKNRFLFAIAAAQAGLINYVNEFWHFSYGDRYAAYWCEDSKKERIAIYGAV